MFGFGKKWYELWDESGFCTTILMMPWPFYQTHPFTKWDDTWASLLWSTSHDIKVISIGVCEWLLHNDHKCHNVPTPHLHSPFHQHASFHIHTCDCLLHMREVWDWQLLIKHPITLTSTTSNHQYLPPHPSSFFQPSPTILCLEAISWQYLTLQWLCTWCVVIFIKIHTFLIVNWEKH